MKLFGKIAGLKTAFPKAVTGLARRRRNIAASIFMTGCCLLLLGTESYASSFRVTTCECLKKPGEAIRVTVQFTNTTNRSVGLRLALTLPSGQTLYYSPVGLVTAKVAWFNIPAGAQVQGFDIINLTLTKDSFPFGPFPIVGPFRYEFSGELYDLETKEILAGPSLTYFEFARRDPSPAPTKSGTMFVFAHQHNELAWLDREDVYLPLGAAWLRNAVLEAERRPDFRFVIDQKSVLETFVQLYPELVQSLRNLIDKGVCELSGGFIVEPDLNLISGESIVRQAIYGQSYLETTWGRRSRMGWNLDNFGQPHQMPQICKKSGMNYYPFSRGFLTGSSPQASIEHAGISQHPGNIDSHPIENSEFYWQSPDGSRVLAAYLPFSYTIGQNIGKTINTDQELTEIFQLLQPYSSTPNFLAPIGADVGKKVFNSFVPEATETWSQKQVSEVNAKMATPSEFFAAVEKAGANLKVLSNIEFQSDEDIASPRIFPGSYASRIGIKQNNSRLENLLLDAEKIATLASLVGFVYPEASLREQGESLALNQTHDYLPGTGIDEAYEDSDDKINDLGDRADAINKTLSRHLDEAAKFLIDQIQTTPAEGNPVASYVVFNTMAWERQDLVQIQISDSDKVFPAKLVDSNGTELRYQRLKSSNKAEEVVFIAKVPALGYATFHFLPGDPSWTVQENRISFTRGINLELGQFSVGIDPQGFIQEIRSNSTQESLIAKDFRASKDTLGGVLWWADDLYGDSYEYGPALRTQSLVGLRQGVIALQGPVMTRLIAESALGDASTAEREIRLIPEKERIEFATTVSWWDTNKNLYVRFPFVQLTDAKITEGVPYGFRERGNGHYPVLEWAHLGNDSLGLSMLNRGLFGHNFSLDSSTPRGTPVPQHLDITLLRSMDRAVFGDYPSTAMKEHGTHRFDYALAPHHGSWRQKKTPRLGWEFNTPLLAYSTTAHRGPLPAQRSYLALNPESDAIVTVVQRQGKDIVLRFYETTGNATKHTLTFPQFNASTIDETNLLGDTLSARGSGTSVTVDTKPEEIMTLRLGNVSSGQ
jgi:alpha-mannosidase